MREVSLYSKEIIKDKKTLMLPIRLHGKTFRAVVDTAAQVSVMNPRTLNVLGLTCATGSIVHLRGVGSNSTMRAQVLENTVVEVGNIMEKMSFVVADISDSIILGIDFLDRHHAVINLSNYTVTLDVHCS